MKKETISYNGKLTQWGDLPFTIDELLSSNFLYQKIHTIERKPLHLKSHIELLKEGYKKLYGVSVELDVDELRLEIERLLVENRYHRGSVLVVIYLFPPQADGEIPRIMSCERQLLYMGYTLWHTAMKAVVATYDVSLNQHQSASSLSAHSYSKLYATRKGADVAMTANRGGEITSVGEYPFFGVDDMTLYTPSFDDGAADSIERRLGVRAAQNTNRKVIEQPILLEQLKELDEMFYITPQGVVSIGWYDGHLLPNSAAASIATELNNLTNQEI